MRPLTKLFPLLLLLLAGGFPAVSQAQVPQGNCELGTSAQDLDINNVRARLYNKGNLFFDGGDPNYEVPKGSGIHSIFAGGIWLGGTVNGNLRIAAATYAQGGENYEFYPGPLNEDGSLPNPNDCTPYDKMWKVSAVDIAAYRAGGAPAADLASWPTGLGAPTCIDVNGNGRCGNNEPDVEVTSRDQVIDLGAGQLPRIRGDMGIWWVMNDAGGPHLTTLSDPIGMEVRVLAFAFARADALGEATFYEYTFIYRGQQPLENTFLTIWSDPDLGNYVDDYIGSDPDLGLGFVYNADNDDEAGSGGYGAAPPALGYDFFQGPLVDANGDGELEELAMTKFGYYNNTADPRTGNVNTDTDYYNTMRGFWKDGTPWTEGGDATNTDGTPVDFVYPNSGTPQNPTPGYWSEVCPEPSCATPIPPNDRRFVMSTGPFTMNPGEEQKIVYGISWAQGADNFGSLQAMKVADELAQRAFDLGFELAPPPPAPNVEAATLNGQAALVWSYPPSSSNYLGSYDEVDPLIGGLPGIEDSTYTFEAFNVYRYPTADFNDANRVLVATYDVVNGVTTVIDEMFDPEIGDLVPFVAFRGTDSGVQFYHIINEQVTNYTDYYYGVTAVAYNEESTPDILESQASKITVRPANVAAGQGGSIPNADLGQAIVAVREGGGTANVAVTVVDPTKVTGHTYRVEIVGIEIDGEPATTYRIVNATTGEVELDGVALFNDQGIHLDPTQPRSNVVDGLSFFVVQQPDLPEADIDLVPDFAGDGAGIIEVANPASAICEEGSTDGGCFYGGNTVWLDPNTTGDYFVTATGQDLGVSGLGRYVTVAVPDDFEIRFTQECATPGNCLGFYGLSTDLIASVPFELWYIGANTPDDPSDDIRMIPILLLNEGEEVTNWADYFPAEEGLDLDGDGEAETYPVTNRIYWMMPDRPNGYDLFEAAANSFGGPGATYDAANDPDTQEDINPSTGQPCATQGYFIDFCYRGAGTFVYPIGRMAFGDIAGDGTTPDVGVTVRVVTTPKALFVDGDVYTIDTAELAFVTNDAATAEAALDLISAVPNPYRGFSVYETGQSDRRVRFTNLPDEATIRIFTLSGTLIKTIRHFGTRSTDWNLATEQGLPVASGMYLVHIEVPGVGEKVLKLGVVNRESRFDAF